MSRAYVTELVGETPVVVVIADPTITLTHLQTALETHHLSLQVIKPTEITTPKAQNTLQIAYRIVWLCPLWSIPLIATAGQQTAVLSALQQHQDRSVLVVTRDTPLSSTDKQTAPNWQHMTEAQNQFITWASHYVRIPVLTYIDAFSLADGQVVSSVVEYMLSEKEQISLVDPQIHFFPQTWTAILQDVTTQIIKPLPQSQVIKGKRVSTTALAKLLALHLQRLGGPLFSTKTTEVGDSVDLPGNAKTTLSVQTIDELVSTITPTLKLIAVKLAQLVPPSSNLESNLVSRSSALPRPQTQQPRTQATQVAAKPTPLVITPPPKAIKIPPKIIPKVTTSPITVKSVAQSQPSIATTENKPLKTAVSAQVDAGSPPKRSITPKPSVSPKPSVTPKPMVSPSPLPQPEDSLAELDSSLNYLFQKYRSQQKVEQVKTIAAVTKATKKRSLRRRKTFWLGVVMITIGLGVVSLFGLYWLGVVSLRQQIVHAATQVTEEKTVSNTKPTFFPWLGLVKTQTSLYSVFLPKHYTQTARQTTDIAQSWMNVMQHQTEMNQASTHLILAMTNRYPIDVAQQLTRITSLGQSTYQDISLIQANLKQLQATETDSAALNSVLQTLNTHKRGLAGLQQLQPILGDLIGLEGKRTYALVFQNDQELRSQGGVIQSVAFITLDQGLIVDTKILSAAEVDAAMTGVPQPPQEVAKYIGGNRWLFRDSSWSADGPTAGKQVAVFLEKASTRPIDGVIFLNSVVLKEWLKAVGPLELPAFNEEITDRNLQAKLEVHSDLQVDHTKPDYPSALLTAVVQKTLLTPESKIPLLLQVLASNLDKKQMSFILMRPEELATISNLAWTGELLTPPCPTQLQHENCVVDTLAVAEANVGVNKANSYIDRWEKHQATIQENQVQHHHTLNFVNKAISNSWPRGTYKAYIRFYLPVTASQTIPAINGQKVDSKNFDSYAENGRQVVGVYVEVPVQEQTEVTLAYSVPYSALGAYVFFTQFQAGITPPEYQVSITTPLTPPSVIAPQAAISGNTVTFTPTKTLNSLVGIKFE